MPFDRGWDMTLLESAFAWVVMPPLQAYLFVDSGVRFCGRGLSVNYERQLLADSVEKVGHGFHGRKILA
jgi:hypothetical protein